MNWDNILTKEKIEDLLIYKKLSYIKAAQKMGCSTKRLMTKAKKYNIKSTYKSNEDKKLNINHLNEIVKKHNGECLSKEYINNSTKLKWKCVDGHIFHSRPSDVKNGSWCPHCASGVAERKCRYIFEQIFKKEFPNTKRILKNKYELDGFNKELNIAFEYHGEQHYRYIKKWHISKEKFKKLQDYDKEKESLCEQKKIKLVVIPYSVYDKGDENLFNYIVEELNKLHIKADLQYSDLEMDKKSFYPNKISELEKAARKKGGKCLSTIYNGAREKHKFQCSKGHQWEATADSVKRMGSWCPTCYEEDKKEKAIQHLEEVVNSKNGYFNRNDYVNVHKKIDFVCKEKHQWKATPKRVISGDWCQKCARQKVASLTRLSLEEVHNFAKEHNGMCLSKEYKNSKALLKWKCENNHIWEKSLETMKRRTKNGFFCLECKKNDL